MNTTAYTTDVTITPAMRASARAIGEAMIAVRRSKGKAQAAALDVFRAANVASRAQHGDDLHEFVKVAAMSGAFGGKA